MKKIEGVNDISQKLLDTVPPLEPGKVVQYRLASIKPDPLNPGHIICPAHMGLPMKEKIYDPFAKKWIEIGVIRDITTETDAKGKVVERVVWDEVAFTSNNFGIITLYGDQPGHEDWHIRLWLSDYNLDNPNRRDIFGDCLFNFIDPIKKATQDTKLRNLRLDAQLAIRNLDDDAIMSFAIALGADPEADFAIMLDRLQREADANPEKFMSLTESNDPAMKAALVKAHNAGIIKFDEQAWAFKWGATDDVITTDIPRSVKDKHMSLVGWLKSSKHGPDVYEEIAKAVSALKTTKAKKK